MLEEYENEEFVESFERDSTSNEDENNEFDFRVSNEEIEGEYNNVKDPEDINLKV